MGKYRSLSDELPVERRRRPWYRLMFEWQQPESPIRDDLWGALIVLCGAIVVFGTFVWFHR